MEELALPADKAQDELPALAAPRPPPASPSWGPRTRRTFTAATRGRFRRLPRASRRLFVIIPSLRAALAPRALRANGWASRRVAPWLTRSREVANSLLRRGLNSAEPGVRRSSCVAQTSCLTPPSKRPRTVSTGAPTAPGCPPEAASHPRVWSHTPCRWPVCPHPNQIPLTRTKSSKSSGRCLTSGIDSTNSRCVFLSFEQDLDYAVATRPPGSRRQPSKPPVLITTFDGRPREGSPCSNFQSIAKLHIRLLCTLLNISKLFISFTSFRYL
ncbi:uncharacterized protein LOC141972514 isoform X3 [Athene noctua]|uniref:uncharacterized protein LOC141972514 isoform X3 n=1 Tax=Athene noctua TaxID=126797 RepID=UPI003EB6AD28